MDIFNQIINFIFGILFMPFQSIDPVWGMIVISFLTGIVMLLVFKITSDQRGIRRAKDLVKAHFLAIRLYRDDITLMFETMRNILASNLGYIKKSLRPMLFLIVPVALILVQLGVRYEFRPLQVGESTVLTLRLQKNATFEDLKNVELELPEGLKLAAPPVRIEMLKEISWRITAEETGVYDIGMLLEENRIEKRMHVVDELVQVTPQIASDFTTPLIFPGERKLNKTAFASSISLNYPRRDFTFFGLDIHWLIAFFVLSVVFGFAFKNVMGVEV
ncbi:hypothetical protein GWO43_20130 [candidate division KSB1 bacterium]|nr:hypothetical protein [candidate division KSB1 bacterium]NIR71672.1 hypothetical protein [candidate division KSB1 bacterium]NIS26384.1 hypothetical protein [candidate division KSB1 bacterium]NIT73143.1 hypothetical protein [candidate division KSB1 bacterium]NIU27070.1 hypothetical protein [candidate division KSB1 bacterium]